MNKRLLLLLALAGIVTVLSARAAPARLTQQNPHLVVYQGDTGPGRGKHIVFLAGDQEYRSEETLPALARILARRYGFKSSVFFTIDPATTMIDGGSNDIDGLDALRTADLLVIFLRFRDFPDAQMQHIVDYLDRGGPIVGLRTATHAFQIRRPDAKFRQFDWQAGEPFVKGFGRQILGETWVAHYGTNHKQSSRLVPAADQTNHPILRGVKDMWVQSGGYVADPIEGSVTLVKGQILDGMMPDSPPSKEKTIEYPVAWHRIYSRPSGKSGRVFTTTHGASEDLLNDGFRRMLVNACLWAAGLEKNIQPTSDVAFVGPYRPTTYSMGGWSKDVKVSDLAGWESPIGKK